MLILPVPLALPPRRSGKPCQASTSWTILFTSSANLLNLQITSRRCPKSNIFCNWTKKSIILLCQWWMYGLCHSIVNLDIIPFGTWKIQNQPSYEYHFIVTRALQVCTFSTLFHSAWFPVLHKTWAAPCHLLPQALLPGVAPGFWARTPLPSPTLSPQLPLCSWEQNIRGKLYADK